MVILGLILIALAAITVFHIARLIKTLIHWLIVIPYLLFFGTEKQVNRAYEKHVLKGSDEEKKFNEYLDKVLAEEEITH